MPDGQSVRAIFSAAEDSAGGPAVVFAHGFGSDRKGEKVTAFEEECARRGWGFSAFDFRGHGESDGSMLDLTGTRMIEDLDAVSGEVQKLAGGPIFLVGSSMGGWASAWLSANDPARAAGCAFIAPAFRFLEFLRLGDDELESWKQLGRYRVTNEFVDVEIGYPLFAQADRFRFEKLAELYNLPAVIFHGMQDDLVPYPISIEFAERCRHSNIELHIFKDGDHRLNLEKDRMARLSCDFFADLVGDTGNNMV